MTRDGMVPASVENLTPDELREQVAYLKAFGSAVRTQLRSYLEALISDVETEWGKADPGALPQHRPTPYPRSGSTEPNVALDAPAEPASHARRTETGASRAR